MWLRVLYEWFCLECLNMHRICTRFSYCGSECYILRWMETAVTRSAIFDIRDNFRDVLDPIVLNLTKLVTNVTLKFLSWNMAYIDIFAAKNINVFENTLATTVNEFVINELIKLTLLCRTGPSLLSLHQSPSETGSSLKVMNLLPRGTSSFLSG